jgi:ribosome-associated protein
MIQVSEKLWIDERAIEESFVRASGPGGQNVKKVASAVQLRLDLAGSGLPEDVRRRLEKLAGRRLAQDGTLIIMAQRHRTQERNRDDALQRLFELIRRAGAPPKPRRPTRPTAAARRRRLEAKAHRARIKGDRTAKPDPE